MGGATWLRASRRLGPGVAVVVLLLGACGQGDDDLTSTSDEATSTSRRSTTTTAQPTTTTTEVLATAPPTTRAPATTNPPATAPPRTQPPATQPPATQPPATQPPATDPPQQCHPNYSGCLDPNSSDYDCAGGSGNGPDYTGPVEVHGSDPFDLDRDGDGLGCED